MRVLNRARAPSNFSLTYVEFLFSSAEGESAAAITCVMYHNSGEIRKHSAELRKHSIEFGEEQCVCEREKAFRVYQLKLCEV